MIDLKTLLKDLTRVGKTTSKQLEKIGLKTIDDLIHHYPFRYDDYSKILSISELKTKKSGTIKAKINLIANHRSFKKRMIITEAIVSDSSDSIKITWFNQPYLVKTLKSGQTIYLAGKVDYDDYYGLQLTSPSYELLDKNPIHTGRMVPIYSTTTNLTQKQIRFLIKQTLPVIQQIKEWLPRQIRVENNLIDLSFAFEQIHFPQNQKWLEKATYRLKFNELFLIQLRNQFIRKKLKNLQAPKIKFKLKPTQNFVNNLPFKLTNAQKKCSYQIIQDMEKNHLMNRLLEGDVGSGKTVVSAIGILNVLLNKYQVAYMAPTEILGTQHFKTFCKLFKNLGFKIGLLTRENIKTNQKSKITKAKLIEQIKSHKIDLIIGTHALIQEKIKFKNLGLCIIDEQHRFGVKQREKLIEKAKIKNKDLNYSPHFLSMTATPIPRSVALTLYGDLDLSIIDQMPVGRKKIITKIVQHDEIKNTYKFVKSEIKKKKQVFVICPLIDVSDKLGVKSVKEEYKKLNEKIFPDLKIKMLHGKLKAKEKEKIIKDFSKNKINILVSTTVVEVGIDIPNATVMIIQGAERFGLAQLHQLRGRIGRDKEQSHCFLFLELESEKAKKRLKALLLAKNGFELAEYDLKMRGHGEIFGSKQSGFITDLKIAKLSDVNIISQAQNIAKNIFNKDPELINYPNIKQKINQIIQTTHLE